jgi:hypothetical protein
MEVVAVGERRTMEEKKNRGANILDGGKKICSYCFM